MPNIMENLKKRKLSAEHIKLVRKLRVTWVSVEAGAPMINSDNPFGSLSAHESMAIILGLPEPTRLSMDQRKDLDHMLVDIGYDIPRIFQSTATIKPGKYLIRNTMIEDYPAGRFNINIDGAGDYDFGKAPTLEFELTEDHIKLLKIAQWKYWCIDPKRPYGDATNYYVDMAKALGIAGESKGESKAENLTGKVTFTLKETKRMDRLHGDMVFAFAVLLQYGEIQPGVFVERGHNHWQRFEDPPVPALSPAPGAVQASISTSTNLISAQPENALLYASRASYLRQSRQYEPAINDYTKALSIGKDNALAYMWYEGRGNLYAIVGKDTQAIQDFTEALALQPDYLPVRYARARSYNVLKQYTEALADCNAIVDAEPNWNYEVYYSRGVANLCLGEPKLASADFHQFLQRDNWHGKTAPYAVLLGYVAYQVPGNVHGARELLGAAETRLKSHLWPHPIIMYLLDKETVEGVLNQAASLEALTESHWFIGAKHVFEKRMEEASVHLRWVVDHGAKNTLDYDLAKTLLEYIS